jgi:hypothetical protein
MLNPNDLITMAALLDEAAEHLSAFMGTALAEQRQLRHFLPDELEGSAIMLREEAARGVALPAGPLAQAAAGMAALNEGHDPLCMAVLRGKACTCGVSASDGQTKPPSHPDGDNT